MQEHVYARKALIFWSASAVGAEILLRQEGGTPLPARCRDQNVNRSVAA